MKALDLSFDAPKVTTDWCMARFAGGHRLLIGNLWTGNRQVAGTAQALRIWREAGDAWWATLTDDQRAADVKPLTAAYFCVHDWAPAKYHFDFARDNAGDEWPHLSFVAVDVEIDPTSVPTIVDAYQLVMDVGADQRAMIYTRRGFWAGNMGDPTDVRVLGLWDAAYGLAPSLADPGYGGWTERRGHQYQGTTDVDGIACDLSVFDDAWVLQTTPPVPAPPATEDEITQLHARWADAQALHRQADALHAQANAIEAEVISEKVRLGLQ